MLIIAGTQLGYRITELVTWRVGQVLGADGDIVREVTVTRALSWAAKVRGSGASAAGGWCSTSGRGE